jgi:hypothetical protein
MKAGLSHALEVREWYLRQKEAAESVRLAVLEQISNVDHAAEADAIPPE